MILLRDNISKTNFKQCFEVENLIKAIRNIGY